MVISLGFCSALCVATIANLVDAIVVLRSGLWWSPPEEWRVVGSPGASVVEGRRRACRMQCSGNILPPPVGSLQLDWSVLVVLTFAIAKKAQGSGGDTGLGSAR